MSLTPVHWMHSTHKPDLAALRTLLFSCIQRTEYVPVRGFTGLDSPRLHAVRPGKTSVLDNLLAACAQIVPPPRWDLSRGGEVSVIFVSSRHPAGPRPGRLNSVTPYITTTERVSRPADPLVKWGPGRNALIDSYYPELF